MPGWTVDEAIQRVQEVTYRIGHEPSSGDMGGNIGAYVRLFGSWEHAKEIAGVKHYAPPPVLEPVIYEVPPDPNALTSEELAEERRLFLLRRSKRQAEDPVHVIRPGRLTSHLGKAFRGFMDNEYLPPDDAFRFVRGR